MAFDIKKNEKSGRVAVLSISGRLTAATAPEVKQEIKSLISTGHIDLILNMENTEFIDSSGLSAIVSGLKQVRELQGSLKLASLKTEVQSIFKLTMLDRVFEIYPTVESALEKNNIY
jgi:anti-sigma B factor antagonist